MESQAVSPVLLVGGEHGLEISGRVHQASGTGRTVLGSWHHHDARKTVASQMDDEVIVVRGDVEEPDAVLTGDDRRPFSPAVRMSGRHGELEVGMAGVVDDVQRVTRRLDAV